MLKVNRFSGKPMRFLTTSAALGAILISTAGCVLEPAPEPVAVAPGPYYAAPGPYYYPEYPPYYAYGPSVGVGVGYYGGRGGYGHWR